MRISDWSSDVCSSDLMADVVAQMELREPIIAVGFQFEVGIAGARLTAAQRQKLAIARSVVKQPDWLLLSEVTAALDPRSQAAVMTEVLERRKDRSEEHTSELQSLMRISYAVFCLKKKHNKTKQ